MRPKTLDNYALSGFALLAMCHSRLCLEATSFFLGQVVGCDKECMKWQVSGYVKAKHGGTVSSEETRAILRMTWSLGTAAGLVNFRIPQDLEPTALHLPEVYGSGGTKGKSVTDLGLIWVECNISPLLSP